MLTADDLHFCIPLSLSLITLYAYKGVKSSGKWNIFQLNDKRVKLWEGSASNGDTINLAESAYGYNWLVFLNTSDGIKATLPITPDMRTVRCAGTALTENGNFGSFGIHGSLTNNGSTVELNSVGYITHTAGSDHTRVSARTVSEVYGFR